MKRVIILSFCFSAMVSCGTTRQQKTVDKAETPAGTETIESKPAVEEVKKENSSTKKIQNSMLIGEIEKNDLLTPPFEAWFTTNYEQYDPAPETLEAIKKNLSEVDLIKVYMGTWCPDSRREVPKFFKILDLAGYNLDNVKMVGVTRSKSAPDNSQEELKILRVPTFIFYKDGEEIERFVERPRVSLEADVAKIISGEDYKHSYEK